MKNIALLVRAIQFAASKHRDQRRKEEEASSYINHPIGVAEVLADAGKVADSPILLAAVLHDTACRMRGQVYTFHSFPLSLIPRV